jgi:hypothetical protein
MKTLERLKFFDSSEKHIKAVREFSRYLCAYNGHERRTDRGLFLLYTQNVTFFLGIFFFAFCVLFSSERGARRVSREFILRFLNFEGLR